MDCGPADAADPMDFESCHAPNDDEELCECYHALAEVLYGQDFGAVVRTVRGYRFAGNELVNFALVHGEPALPIAALRAAGSGRTDQLHFFFSRGVAAPPHGLQLPPDSARALDNECLYQAVVRGHFETVEYLLEPLGGGLTATDAAQTLARIRATLGDDPPELWKRPDIYGLLDQKKKA